MSRLYDLYWDRWHARATRRAWTDPTWAAIEARRATTPDGGKLRFSEEDGLGVEEWELQNTIWKQLNPPTPVIRIRWWLKANGVRVKVRQVRRFVQRGRRGWADEDVWNLNLHLAGVIAGSVEALRTTGHCHPHELTEEEWDDILQRIALGFRAFAVIYEDRAPELHEERLTSLKEASQLLERWLPHLDD